MDCITKQSFFQGKVCFFEVPKQVRLLQCCFKFSSAKIQHVSINNLLVRFIQNFVRHIFIKDCLYFLAVPFISRFCRFHAFCKVANWVFFTRDEQNTLSCAVAIGCFVVELYNNIQKRAIAFLCERLSAQSIVYIRFLIFFVKRKPIHGIAKPLAKRTRQNFLHRRQRNAWILKV